MSAHHPSTKAQICAFLAALAAAFLTASIGAIASVSARSFYAELTRPDWAPPGWLFGPVWSVLYLLMAIAMWLVWRSAGFPKARLAAVLFGVQLLANALWSWIFFAWRLGAMAFVEVLVLWVLILVTTVAFWRCNRAAALLLAPYLAWVSFAAALTFAVWQLNPELLA